MLERLFARPYLLLLATTFMWAANAVAGRLATGHIGPLTLTCLRWGLAALIMLPFAWPGLKAHGPLVKRSLPYLAAMSAAGFASFNGFLYSALQMTSAINVAIEQTAMPMMILGLNFLLFRLPLQRRQSIGVLLATCGAVLTVTHGRPQDILRLAVNAGDALMMLGVASYALYSVMLRRKPALALAPFMWLLFIMAFIWLLPFMIYEQAGNAAPFMDWTGLSVLIYAAIFPAILGQLFFVRAVELIGSNRAGVFINLVPVFAAVLAWLTLDEQLQGFQVVGYLLVLTGIIIAQLRSGTGDPNPDPPQRSPSQRKEMS